MAKTDTAAVIKMLEGADPPLTVERVTFDYKYRQTKKTGKFKWSTRIAFSAKRLLVNQHACFVMTPQDGTTKLNDKCRAAYKFVLVYTYGELYVVPMHKMPAGMFRTPRPGVKRLFPWDEFKGEKGIALLR